MAKKTTCPITREQFGAKPRSLKVVIDGKEQEAEGREFSSGSLGWYLNTKVSVQVDGVPVQVQVGLNMIIVGSKELPQNKPAAATAAEPATEGSEPS
jgi:hypothetical protein